MKNSKDNVFVSILLALSIISVSAQPQDQLRTELDALANSFGMSRQSNGQNRSPVNSNSVSRLSNSELDSLIERIDTGEGKFRSSLTDAFGQSRYDPTTSEANMNDAVPRLRTAT